MLVLKDAEYLLQDFSGGRLLGMAKCPLIGGFAEDVVGLVAAALKTRSWIIRREMRSNLCHWFVQFREDARESPYGTR